MIERQSDGNLGAFLGTMRDLETRTSDPTDHEKLEQAVEALTDVDVRRRFVSLLESVNPEANCACSDLGQVTESEARVCALHHSRAGWIVHQARQLDPRSKK
jgi:hypothetical protein